MYFGIIKERKNPPDRRVVLSPAACQIVLDSYEDAQITVEPSDIRVFSNKEYEDAGIIHRADGGIRDRISYDD